MLLCGLALYFSNQFFDATNWVNHTAAVIGEIRATRLLLGTDAPYSNDHAVPLSVASVLSQIDRVAQLTTDNPLQQKNVQDFRGVFASTAPHAQSADARTIQAAYDLLFRMQSEEYRLLIVRTRGQAGASRRAALAVSALCAVLLIVGLIMALAARRESRLRAVADAALQADRDHLTRYSRELALVSAGSELIQAAQDEVQLNAAVARILSEMLPESSGYVGLMSASKDMVEICASWGSGQPPESFQPADCVALQLGRKIHRSEFLVPISCKHVHTSADCVCVPLRSSTGFLGMIYVESAEDISSKRSESIGLFAAQVTLGLTNLRMREALRSQSVRDSLTGLFNRRYFDETLQREIAAYRRESSPLAVLMLDLDHFKRVNDSFGHAAGDDALRALGRLMRSSFRESDVICRYGGEEFAVILMNSDLGSAYAKAESFRRAVEQSELKGNGRDVGRMTTSIGVACCDEFDSPDLLVQAADAALYQAKRMGRNSTCVCSGEPGTMPFVSIPATPTPVWPEAALSAERGSRGPGSRVLSINAPSRPAERG